MRSLLVVTNIFVFFEELSALKYSKEHYDSIYVTFDRNYIKCNTLVEELMGKIFKSLEEFNFIDFEEAVQEYWDNIICSSYITEYMYLHLSEMKYKDINFVEDGAYDYFGSEFCHGEMVRNHSLWLFSPNKSKYRSLFKRVNKIQLDNDLKYKMMNLFPEINSTLKGISKDTPVVFTSPIKEDFGFNSFNKEVLDFIEKNYSGQEVVLKKHPRDMCNYSSNCVKFIETSKELPGQLLNFIFNGDKIYFFPSTVALMSDDLSKTKVIQFSNCTNEQYNNFYSEVKDSVGKIVRI